MNKVNPKTYVVGDEFIDEDAVAIERLAQAALSFVVAKTPAPKRRSSRSSLSLA